jgi:hypothetical protein
MESTSEFGEFKNLNADSSSDNTRVMLQMSETATLCSNCGANNEDESVYCGSCGTRLISDVTISPAKVQSSKLTVLRTIPQRALRELELLKVKIPFKTANITSGIKLSITGKPKISQRDAQTEVPTGTEMPSTTEVNSPPAAQLSTPESPVKGVSNTANRLSTALDKFSSLPLWFTMPLIFACSFSFGMIVRLLM